MAQELYELPQGWEWETLQELGKFSGGGTPSKSNPDFWGGNQLWITPKDMKSEKLRDSQLKITDTAIDKSSAKLIPAGSILIVARSGILRHTLPVCINEIEATVNQDIKVFIPSKKITSAFCQKMLIGHEPMILRDLVKGGVTVESLKYQEFQNHPFPVPPLAEQERIVAKLDALFSRIDQAIAQLQHTQAQTKALFASALDAVFESDKHQYKTLKEISNLVTDGTHHSPKIQHPEAGPERFKYLTSKNVKFHGLKLDNLTYIDKDVHEEIYNRCPPEYLDQLITKDGAMTGTCCLNTLDEPYSLLSSVALIKLKREIRP
jgi:restriction endonuclease S subunit